jgi:hypothetical protein
MGERFAALPGQCESHQQGIGYNSLGGFGLDIGCQPLFRPVEKSQIVLILKNAE